MSVARVLLIILCCAGSTAARRGTPPTVDNSALDAYLQKCGELLHQGNYVEVQLRLAPLAEQHPDHARVQLYLALAFHKQKKYEQALPLFERAIALDPGYAPARMFYGWCLYYLGRIDEADKQFTSYLKSHAGYADAHFALGLIAFDRDQLAAATTQFGAAIDIAARTGQKVVESKARARLGDVHMREANLPAARAEFERSIALNPSNYTVYFKLSRVCTRLGDTAAAERARELFEEVRERVRPTNPRHRPEDQ